MCFNLLWSDQTDNKGNLIFLRSKDMPRSSVALINRGVSSESSTYTFKRGRETSTWCGTTICNKSKNTYWDRNLSVTCDMEQDWKITRYQLISDTKTFLSVCPYVNGRYVTKLNYWVNRVLVLIPILIAKIASWFFFLFSFAKRVRTWSLLSSCIESTCFTVIFISLYYYPYSRLVRDL